MTLANGVIYIPMALDCDLEQAFTASPSPTVNWSSCDYDEHERPHGGSSA